MPDLIVNDLIEHNGFKQWLVILPDHVIENYRTIFGDKGVENINKAITIYNDNFYEFKRYYQFIGLLKYTHNHKSLTMSIFEFNDMDNYLDGFLALQGKNWNPADLNKIGLLVQEIIDDKNKQLASIIIKKVM